MSDATQPENIELAGLTGLAAEVDGAAAAVAAPGDPNAPTLPEPGPDFGMEARGAVDMLGAMICGYAPQAESVWTEPTRERMAASLAPVMAKYGFSFGAMPVELTALIVCGPVLWQSSRIVATKINVDKAAAAARAGEGGPTVADVTPAETPQGEVHPQLALYQK